MSTSTGGLEVLNVGAGDIEVKFNPHQPEELARAIKMLKDMQLRGYAILVREDDGSYVRAKAIDEARGLYIITGDPAPPELPVPVALRTDLDEGVEVPRATTKRRGRQSRTKPIETSHAVGVGRSAGG